MSFNWRLLLARAVLDYVIWHETDGAG